MAENGDHKKITRLDNNSKVRQLDNHVKQLIDLVQQLVEKYWCEKKRKAASGSGLKHVIRAVVGGKQQNLAIWGVRLHPGREFNS